MNSPTVMSSHYIGRDKQAGFTLIELILYIGLLSLFITGAIQFGWTIIHASVKAETQQEVLQNLRLATKRLTYEIRNASGINSIGPATISLAVTTSSRNPTVFDIDNGRLRIGYGNTGPCPLSSPCTLTSNRVTVSNLTFTDLSSGTESTNVGFSITLDHTNLGGRQEWEYSKTHTTAVELRSP